VALVRTDISEELSASFIRVTRIGELGTTLAVTSNRRTLRRNTKKLVLARMFSHTHLELFRIRSSNILQFDQLKRDPRNGARWLVSTFQGGKG
jgi:hypothetical protein